MARDFIRVIARTPAAILCAIGGAGMLAQINGAGYLVVGGIFLQILWLLPKY